MIVTLKTQRVHTLEQVRRVAGGNEPVDFAVAAGSGTASVEI